MSLDVKHSESRRAQWRAYYYRHHEKNIEYQRIYRHEMEKYLCR